MQKTNKAQITLDNYILLKSLGKGYNSEVSLAYNTKDKQYYALKIARNEHFSDNYEAIINEFKILSQIQHENIMRVYDIQTNSLMIKKNQTKEKKMYAVVEFCENGELFDYIITSCGFSEKVARYYFHQLINALELIHDKGLCHRDLKPENLLLDKSFQMKLIDFGFCIKKFGKEQNGKMRRIAGTEFYYPPEIHLKMPYYGEFQDLFAAGIILFMMISASPPFTVAQPDDDYYKLLFTNQFKKFWDAHSYHIEKQRGIKIFTNDFKILIEGMLSSEVSSRLTIAEIKSTKWYKGSVASQEEILEEMTRIKNILGRSQNEDKQTIKNNNNKEEQRYYKQTQQMDRSIQQIQQVQLEFQSLQQDFSNLFNSNRQVYGKNYYFEKFNDYLIDIDKQYLLACIVKQLKENRYDLIKLNDDKYKIFCRKCLNTYNIEFQIKIIELDNNLLCVDFQRTYGHIIYYYKEVNIIKSYLNTLTSQKDQIVEINHELIEN